MSVFNFNETVALDLGFDLNQLYILRYLTNISKTTKVETKIINGKECFHINYSKIFKDNQFAFTQLSESSLNELNDDAKKEYIKKIYDRNNKRFIKMLSGALGKVIIKEKIEKVDDGKKIYFSINKIIFTNLLDGYPVKESMDLTENEKIIIDKLNLNKLTVSITKQLATMKKDILLQACDISRNLGVLDFPYMKSIYNNLLENKKDSSAPTDKSNTQIKSESFNRSNIIAQKINYNASKNKFRNFTETFDKYSEDELDAIIEKSQKEKFE